MTDFSNLTLEPDTEEVRLDAAMSRVASDLAGSLKREEQARRRRRWLMAGGIMLTIATGIGVLGVVLLTAGGALSSPGGSAEQEAWRLWQQGRPAEAEVRFVEALKADPGSVSALNGLGWAQLNQGKRAEAQVAFARCVELEPEHPAALNGLGQLAFAQRDYAGAIAFFERAPGAPAAQIGLARATLLTGDFDTAKAATASLLAGPAIEDAMLQKQVQAMADAADKGALPEALRAQLEPPELPVAGGPLEQAEEGWRLWSRQQLTESEAVFRKVLAVDPDLPRALNGLGWALLSQGKFAEAQPEFEKCLAVTPTHAGAINGLARCQQVAGEKDLAITTWERGVALNPGQATALTHGLAYAYVERGDFAKALPLIELNLAGMPDDPALLALRKRALAGDAER